MTTATAVAGWWTLKNECPTRRGRRKEASMRRGSRVTRKERVRVLAVRVTTKGKGRESTMCAHCGKRGHDASRCWTVHPQQLPWKSTDLVEENHYHQCDHADNNCVSVCSVDLELGSSETVTQRSCSKRNAGTLFRYFLGQERHTQVHEWPRQCL